MMFTGSIMFSVASPDPFTFVVCAQGERALIHENYKVPVLAVQTLVFYGKC